MPNYAKRSPKLPITVIQCPTLPYFSPHRHTLPHTDIHCSYRHTLPYTALHSLQNSSTAHTALCFLPLSTPVQYYSIRPSLPHTVPHCPTLPHIQHFPTQSHTASHSAAHTPYKTSHFPLLLHAAICCSSHSHTPTLPHST